ncbi:PAS domain-containing protein [Pontibacter mangrovi]|uniref:histidine kinase n=1 Tax=Pontibacter mangrovi TaxID=2589816 RepID=A0A501W477_9BACT|nr:PAS domain-containing protein [Pontibacter mangrovi]TPE43445.1 hypothetical protein FJM65_11825 [Pontibacter mangrovi]
MEKEPATDLINFKCVYDNAPCGLLTYKMQGPIMYANQTLLKWLGVSEEEIITKKMPDILDKAGVLYYELFVQPILKMHQEVKEISLRIETPKGAFSCLFNGVAGEGQIVNAVIYKIEDRQKYEKELFLKRSKAEEDNKLKSKALQEVIFDHSHLVRAPLANILGLITLLERTIQNGKEVTVIIAMLQQSASKLDNQITSIVNKANLTS